MGNGDTKNELDLMHIKAEVLEQMSSPVVVFDQDDRIQVYNVAARHLLGITDGITLREFVQDTNLRYLLTPERSEKIISSMVALADSLHMAVIAEGVEEKLKIELLRSVGCRIVQGYYYSKPLTVKQYEAYLEIHGHEDMWNYIQDIKERKTE